MSGPDLGAIKKDWRSRRFSFGVFIDPPGQAWEDYVHAVDELFMVLEGDVEIEIGGRVLHPRPGEELRIPARTCHSVRNRGTSPSRWLYGYRL